LFLADKTGSGSAIKKKIAFDVDWFLIAIMIAIAVSKPGSDCERMPFEKQA
jgi:hypothetical protein